MACITTAERLQHVDLPGLLHPLCEARHVEVLDETHGRLNDSQHLAAGVDVLEERAVYLDGMERVGAQLARLCARPTR